MLERRSLLTATAAISSFVGAIFGARKANAATSNTNINLTPKGDVEPRGSNGRNERLPSLDLESKHDFANGFRTFHLRFGRVVRARINKILEEKGIDPKADLTIEETLELLGFDHILATSGRTWISNQQLTRKIFTGLLPRQCR